MPIPNKNQTIVYKISDNLKDEIIEHYTDTMREKKPPYSVFQSEDAGTIVTLYESGKIMFQGISADIDYAWWRDREKFLNNRNLDSELKAKEKKDQKKKDDLNDPTYKFVSTIGSDEVGTGDYFGPIVVTASYVSKENISFMKELGVRDSKKLDDTKILAVVPKLVEKIPFVTFTLTPEEYNKAKIFNMNAVKAILHNKVLYNLVNKENYDYKFIVVDQFCPVTKYFEHIKNVPNVIRNIEFTTHAEEKCYSVAASSLISRYIFLKEIDKLSKKYNMNFPKGAGDIVDTFGVEFITKYGKTELNNVAKINFKNTEKIDNLSK